MLHSVDVLHGVPTFLELWVVDLTMLVILNYVGNYVGIWYACFHYNVFHGL